MPYNYKSIKEFVDKVNKEAEKAAQDVYDKYETELLKRVQNQLKEGDNVWYGMGTATIEGKNDDVGENLATTLGQLQYWSDNISAGFSLPYCFTKNEILED